MAAQICCLESADLTPPALFFLVILLFSESFPRRCASGSPRGPLLGPGRPSLRPLIQHPPRPPCLRVRSCPAISLERDISPVPSPNSRQLPDPHRFRESPDASPILNELLLPRPDITARDHSLFNYADNPISLAAPSPTAAPSPANMPLDLPRGRNLSSRWHDVTTRWRPAFHHRRARAAHLGYMLTMLTNRGWRCEWRHFTLNATWRPAAGLLGCRGLDVSGVVRYDYASAAWSSTPAHRRRPDSTGNIYPATHTPPASGDLDKLSGDVQRVRLKASS